MHDDGTSLQTEGEDASDSDSVLTADLNVYREIEYLIDLQFVDIKVGSSGYQTGNQGGYTVQTHSPMKHFIEVSTKDSP